MHRASRQGHVQGFACHIFDMGGQSDNAIASLQQLQEGNFSLKLLVRGLATPNSGSTLHKCLPEKHPFNEHQQNACCRSALCRCPSLQANSILAYRQCSLYCSAHYTAAPYPRITQHATTALGTPAHINRVPNILTAQHAIDIVAYSQTLATPHIQAPSPQTRRPTCAAADTPPDTRGPLQSPQTPDNSATPAQQHRYKHQTPAAYCISHCSQTKQRHSSVAHARPSDTALLCPYPHHYALQAAHQHT